MCCRAYVEYLKDEELRKIYGLLDDKEGIKESGEIFPTDTVLSIARKKDGSIGVFKMKWGYGIREKNIFNARMESVRSKDTFRDGIQRRRCVIPVINYFEWQTDTKIKCAIKSMEGLTYLLGIYRINGGVPEFVVLTREATEKMKNIHGRMPLILEKKYLSAWITDDDAADYLMEKTATELTVEESK